MTDVPASDLPSHLAPQSSAEVPASDLPTGLKATAALQNPPPPPKEKQDFRSPYAGPFGGALAGAYGFATNTYGFGGDVGIPGLPTTEETRGELTKAGVPSPPAFVKSFETAGEWTPAVLGGLSLAKGAIGAGARALGKTAIGKAGLGLIEDLRGTESAARTARLSESLGTGQMGKNILSRATKAATRRKDVADRLYEVAEDRMNARFQKGETWQESPAGRAFFKYIGDRLSTANGTNVTSDQRRVLIDLARELAGTEREGGGIAYSTPKVLTTTLRELREAAAGDPKEGFKAIGQQEAGDLAKKLSQSIGEWEPAHQTADVQYKFHTKQLYPEGVTPGKFPKEKKAADKTINLLENRLKQGTIKPEDVTKQVRSALKSPSVARLVSETDARQINAELDAIDKIKAREDKVRAVTKFSAKWLGAGALGAAGIDLLRGGP